MKLPGNKPLSVVLLVAVVVFAFYTGKRFSQLTESQGHYHGDVLSELQTFRAGFAFAHCGFLRLKLEPADNRYAEDCQYEPGDFYTHLPDGPALMSGLLQKLGFHHLLSQRAVLYGLSMTALVFLVLSLRIILASLLPRSGSTIALVTTAIALCSPWFIYWACPNAYSDLLLFLGLWLLLMNRLRAFVLVCFLQGFFYYELVPFMFLMGCFKMALEFRQGTMPARKAGGYVLWFFLAPTAAVALHFLQNAWFFGGVHGALQDWMTIGAFRTGLRGHYSAGAHLVKQAFAVLWYYGSALLLLAVIGAAVAIRSRNLWPLVLFFLALVWQILMREVSAVHAFSARDFGLGILALGVLGLVSLLEDQRQVVRLAGYGLLWLCVLRLPLGAEFSKNPLFLKGWETVVHQTDPATLVAFLADGRSTLEHQDEKAIVIRELARRTSVLPDLPRYEFVCGSTRVVLGKVEGTLNRSDLPAKLLPRSCHEPPPYSDLFGADNNAVPVRIEVAGTPNRWRLLLLNCLFRFI